MKKIEITLLVLTCVLLVGCVSFVSGNKTSSTTKNDVVYSDFNELFHNARSNAGAVVTIRGPLDIAGNNYARTQCDIADKDGNIIVAPCPNISKKELNELPLKERYPTYIVTGNIGWSEDYQLGFIENVTEMRLIN